MALWAKFGACGAGNETGRLVSRDGRRRRWSATITLCQWRVSHRHWSVSPIHDWMCLVAAGEPQVDEWWPTWLDALNFCRKRPLGAFHAWTGDFSSWGSRRCPLAVCGESRLRSGGHVLHTTPSPPPAAGHHPLRKSSAALHSAFSSCLGGIAGTVQFSSCIVVGSTGLLG